MKILLHTNYEIEKDISRCIDHINIYTVNLENLFDNGMVVLDKYSSLFMTLYKCDWIFINTIFSFLYKLNKEWDSLYYKQLHTKLLERVKNFLRKYNINVFLYACDREVQEYLDIQCIPYVIFDSKDLLISELNSISRNERQKYFIF